jgi:hypothetical protein
MDALVTAILFGVTGLDALDVDTQAQPPHGEPGQAEDRAGR